MLEAVASLAYYAKDDEERAMCSKCKGGESCDGNEILLCDGPNCPEAFHMRCLKPPLQSVPEGAWYCPACASQANAKDVASMSVGALKAVLVTARTVDDVAVSSEAGDIRVRGGDVGGTRDVEGLYL